MIYPVPDRQWADWTPETMEEIEWGCTVLSDYTSSDGDEFTMKEYGLDRPKLLKAIPALLIDKLKCRQILNQKLSFRAFLTALQKVKLPWEI